LKLLVKKLFKEKLRLELEFNNKRLEILVFSFQFFSSLSDAFQRNSMPPQGVAMHSLGNTAIKFKMFSLIQKTETQIPLK
jgi:hypothetical protein